MKASEILSAMAEDEDVTRGVIEGLGHGMLDEWDCGLDQGLFTFGPFEWSLAAKSGASYMEAQGA